MNPTIRMVQISKYGWNMVAPKGHILVADLSFAYTHQAEAYVRNYISSFQNWDYQIEVLG